MASETLSLRHGVRFVPESGVTVEEVLLAVGEQVGCENIYSASRMNREATVGARTAGLTAESPGGDASAAGSEGHDQYTELVPSVAAEASTSSGRKAKAKTDRPVREEDEPVIEHLGVIDSSAHEERVGELEGGESESEVESLLSDYSGMSEIPVSCSSQPDLPLQPEKPGVPAGSTGQAAVLYLPTHEGGQGLIDLESRVAAFRLKAAQQLLYHSDLCWKESAHALLRIAGRIGLDRHLFLLNADELDLSGLGDFYTSAWKAWRLLKATHEEGTGPKAWVWEEPIFHNKMIPLRSVCSTALRRSFLDAGICKMGHLRVSDGSGWKTAQLLAQQTGINSQRLLEQFLSEVWQALSKQVQEFLELPRRDAAPEFPLLRVTAADGGWQENRGTLLSFSSPSLRLFEDADGKALYVVCVKVRNLRALAEVREHCRHDLLRGQSMAGYRWRVLYKLPVPKRSGDLQWCIIHGAIATNQHTAHFVPGMETTCPFCSEPESVEHLFIQCSRLNILFGTLHTLCLKLDITFTYGLFILGPKYTRSQQAKCCLLNFLFGQAKLAIWLTRRNKLRRQGLIDPDVMLKSFIRARVKVDFAYYKAMNDLVTFEKMWCVGEALCCVEDGAITMCM
ncbi:hypothetical protein AOLI_G00004210 [Acnodon oligacanthus]